MEKQQQYNRTITAKEIPGSEGETSLPYGEIYSRAVIKWGVDAQIYMLIEEMGELIVALMHKNRQRANNVAEELADVEIMLGQIRPLFNQEKEVDQWFMTKMKRLEERLL